MDNLDIKRNLLALSTSIAAHKQNARFQEKAEKLIAEIDKIVNTIETDGELAPDNGFQIMSNFLMGHLKLFQKALQLDGFKPSYGMNNWIKAQAFIPIKGIYNAIYIADNIDYTTGQLVMDKEYLAHQAAIHLSCLMNRYMNNYVSESDNFDFVQFAKHFNYPIKGTKLTWSLNRKLRYAVLDKLESQEIHHFEQFVVPMLDTEKNDVSLKATYLLKMIALIKMIKIFDAYTPYLFEDPIVYSLENWNPEYKEVLEKIDQTLYLCQFHPKVKPRYIKEIASSPKLLKVKLTRDSLFIRAVIEPFLRLANYDMELLDFKDSPYRTIGLEWRSLVRGSSSLAFKTIYTAVTSNWIWSSLVEETLYFHKYTWCRFLWNGENKNQYSPTWLDQLRGSDWPEGWDLLESFLITLKAKEDFSLSRYYYGYTSGTLFVYMHLQYLLNRMMKILDKDLKPAFQSVYWINTAQNEEPDGSEADLVQEAEKYSSLVYTYYLKNLCIPNIETPTCDNVFFPEDDICEGKGIDAITWLRYQGDPMAHMVLAPFFIWNEISPIDQPLAFATGHVYEKVIKTVLEHRVLFPMVSPKVAKRFKAFE